MDNLVKFNINEYMYIRITDKGWQHLMETVGDKYIKHCISTKEVIIDSIVWHRLQAHAVFSYFPDSFGSMPYYNTTVMFDNKDLTPYKQ